MTAYSAGFISGLTLNSGDTLDVGVGGSAVAVTVNSGAEILVHSGGIVLSSTVSSGGTLTVSSGGQAGSTWCGVADWRMYLDKPSRKQSPVVERFK